MDLRQIAKATSGELINKTTLDNIEISRISSDTRENLEGTAFIALVGEIHNAHKFLAQAIEAGAKALIISDVELTNKYDDDLPIVLVKDTNQALLDIARLYRDKLETKLIAISGSVGKTSTKDAVSQALSVNNKVYKTDKNLNNNFGVPYTIFAIEEDSDFAVIELGMDGRGQIEATSIASNPDICILTNIGTSHIEFLGSRQEILEAKSEILIGAKKHAPLIINAEDPYLLELARTEVENRPIVLLDSAGLGNSMRSILEEDSKLEEVTEDAIEQLSNEAEESFTQKILPGLVSGIRYHADNLEVTNEGIKFNIYKGLGAELNELVEIKLHAWGPQLVENILFAIATADIFDEDLAAIVKSFENEFKISSGRQELHKLANNNLLIDDSYNASPESMKSAFILSSLIENNLNYRSKIAIIGGVNELGEYSKKLHEDIANSIKEHDFDKVYLIGPEADNMLKVINENNKDQSIAKSFSTNETIIGALELEDIKESIILIKGSRGFHLEEIATYLKGKYKV